MQEPDNPATLHYEGSNFFYAKCNAAIWAMIVQTLQNLIPVGPGCPAQHLHLTVYHS